MDSSDEENPRKKKKTVHHDLCILHSKGSSNQNFTVISSLKDPAERIKEIKELKELRQSQPFGSASRMDDVCSQIPDTIQEGQGYHRDCYQRFTNHKARLKKSVPQDAEASTSRGTRSSKDKIIFEPDCIFCNQVGKKSLKKKGGLYSSEDTSFFDFGGGETVKCIAEQKGDDKLLKRIRNVDLFASEARFHPSCRKSYTRDASAWLSKDVDQKSKQRDLEEAHNSALEEVCQEIHREVLSNNGIAKLADLNALYIASLSNTAFPSPDHRTAKLKARLENHDISKRISITPGRGSLVYSKSLDSATGLNLAYKLGAADSISGAAQTLRQIIVESFEKEKNLPWPPSAEYLQEKAKTVLPCELESFLKIVLSGSPDKDNTRINRLALSIGQDICRASTAGKWKLPKHILLCMTLRHLFRSKELITLVNKFGHSENYDFSLELETAIAKSVDEAHSVLSQEIVRNPKGKFVFHSEFDNFDQFVNDLTGSGSVHTAHGIMLQELEANEEIPETQPKSVRRSGQRSARLETPEDLPDCYITVKKSPSMTIKQTTYDCGKQVYDAKMKQNLLWMLFRLHSSKMPGWGGYVSLTGEPPERLTVIGYYPVIYNPITEYKTVQECLRVAEQASTDVGQKLVITTFDLGVCMKAYPIIWNHPERYKDHIILQGTFHLTSAYLKMVGHKMNGSGFSDVLIEAGLIGSGSVQGILSGKNYSRAMNCHKVMLESLERLLFERFMERKQENEPFSSLPEESRSRIKNAVREPTKKTIEAVLQDKHVQKYIQEYENFKVEVRNGLVGKTGKFWISYMDHIWLMLQLHEGVKRNDFFLYAHCIYQSPDLFFSYGGQNYARYTTFFAIFLANIEESHPGSLELMKAGAVSVARSFIPGSRCDVDKTMEETFMKHAKSRGGSGTGITGITKNYSAYQRWVRTTHERSNYLNVTLSMADMSSSETADKHKDLRKAEVKKSQEQVNRTVEAIRGFVNPFTIDPDKLYNISSGAPVPPDIEKDLLGAEKAGADAKEKFIEERLKQNDNFFEPITKLKLKTMADMKKTVKVSSAKNKVVEYRDQGNIVMKLLVKSQEESLKIDMEELMTYCLTPIPYSIGTADGYLAKTDKAKGFSSLTKGIEDESPDPEAKTLTIIDGNALFHQLKELPPNFRQICVKVFDMLPKKGDSLVSTDMYSETSVKALERKRRGESEKLIIKGANTKKPKDWKQFLKNEENKTQLIEILHQVWQTEEVISKLKGRKVILIKEGQAFVISDGNREIEELRSNQEETDSRVALYCQYADTQGYDCARVKSPDSDIFFILLHHSSDVSCEILFDTGTGNNKRLISISKLNSHYGPHVCSALMALHCFTGCDSVSCFKGKGKVRMIPLVKDSPTHRAIFEELGTDWEISNNLVTGLERFLCAMYGKAKFNDVDKVRSHMLKVKCNPTDMKLTTKSNIDLATMPPTQACLREHIKRANYQARIWRLGTTPIFELPKPWEDHGWTRDGDPMWCPPEMILPQSLVDIVEEAEAEEEEEEDEEEDDIELINESESEEEEDDE